MFDFLTTMIVFYVRIRNPSQSTILEQILWNVPFNSGWADLLILVLGVLHALQGRWGCGGSLEDAQEAEEEQRQKHSQGFCKASTSALVINILSDPPCQLAGGNWVISGLILGRNECILLFTLLKYTWMNRADPPMHENFCCFQVTVSWDW